MPAVYALVAAAGSGTRLGFDQPKAFVELAGRTLLERALDGLARSEVIDHAIILVSPDMRETAEKLITQEFNRASWAGMAVSVTLGGGERMDSAWAGLEELARREVPEDSMVAVHDAARCMTPPEMIARVVDSARYGAEHHAWSGSVPVVPVVDTIKVVDQARSGSADGEVLLEQTPARDSLRAAQTPQVFRLDELREANLEYLATVEISSAHASRNTGNQPLMTATDDASLMEMAGKKVTAVDGDLMAMKITTPLDYRVATMLLADVEDADKGTTEEG